MFTPNFFIEAFRLLKNAPGAQSGEFSYELGSFKEAVTSHFKGKRNSHGVYVLSVDQQVLYIGKAGTVIHAGDGESVNLKPQDIPRRLKAPRGKSELEKRDFFFEEWLVTKLKAALQSKPVHIEYVVLPDPFSITPAYAESFLLQSFLQENKRLPSLNSAF